MSLKSKLLDRISFKYLLQAVDTVLIDCDGVIWHGSVPVKGAAEAIDKLRQKRKRVFLVTNNSTKTRSEFVEKCSALGFAVTKDDILGSSYVTSQQLLRCLPHGCRIHCIGSSGLEGELKAVGFDVVGIGPEAMDGKSVADLSKFKLDPKVKCVVVGFDIHFSYAKAAIAASYLHNKDCLFIATNTDSGLPVADGKILPGTGSIVSMIQVASQRQPDVICGKPHQPMFDVLSKHFQVQPQKTLMIGDRLDTDILFAANCGLHSLLILGGFSDLKEVELKQMSNSVLDQKQIPEYYFPSMTELNTLLNELDESY